jgi:hypothetical protein
MNCAPVSVNFSCVYHIEGFSFCFECSSYNSIFFFVVVGNFLRRRGYFWGTNLGMGSIRKNRYFGNTHKKNRYFIKKRYFGYSYWRVNILVLMFLGKNSQIFQFNSQNCSKIDQFNFIIQSKNPPL